MTKITIDRTVVEQALGALEGIANALREEDVLGCDIELLLDAGTNLRAALAEPDNCTWQQDGDSDSGVYGTSCGSYFSIDDGTPEDNKMAWCCYCGRKLTQALITEDEDD